MLSLPRNPPYSVAYAGMTIRFAISREDLSLGCEVSLTRRRAIARLFESGALNDSNCRKETDVVPAADRRRDAARRYAIRRLRNLQIARWRQSSHCPIKLITATIDISTRRNLKRSPSLTLFSGINPGRELRAPLMRQFGAKFDARPAKRDAIDYRVNSYVMTSRSSIYMIYH